MRVIAYILVLGAIESSMAIVFSDITICPLCGRLLLKDDDVTGLPAISDTGHPLYKYFDSAFHTLCFDNWDQKPAALDAIKQERRRYIKSNDFKKMVATFGRPKWADDLMDDEPS